MIEILTAVGTFIGAAAASFLFIWKILPKKVDKMTNNDLRHVEEELKRLSCLPVKVARLDERMKDVEKDTDALTERVNTFINGRAK